MGVVQWSLGMLRLLLLLFFFFFYVKRGVDDATHGGLRLFVCKGDLDFLETDEVGPLPAAKAGTQRGSSGCLLLTTV